MPTTLTTRTRGRLATRPHNRLTNQPKLFYRIQEAANLTGLKPSVLRYWETEFRELRPEKDASDQRRYRQSDLEVILAIRKLLYEDRFTIKGARARLREELRRMRQGGAAPAPADVEAQRPAEVVAEAEAEAEAPVEIARPAEPIPSMTEFRTQPKPSGLDPRKQQLDQSLRKLRSEVNALLSMLS